MKRTDAKSIAEIIGDFMQQEDIEDAVLEQKALRLWHQVVGPGVNRMTTERFVENGVITVKITSAALRNDLIKLRNGEPITAKEYDYTQHRRCDPGAIIQPADVVLIEGIHVFYDPEVRDLMDFKIYIQVDPDVCLLRRVKRDIRDRGRSIESVYRQYLDTVKPMYEKHIRNYVEHADLIVARGGKNARIIDILAHYINSGMIETRHEP